MPHIRAGWRKCRECKEGFRPRTTGGLPQKYCSAQCGTNRRKRLARGVSKHPADYLNGEQVTEIIALFETGRWTFQMLADRYQRHKGHIWRIVQQISGEYHFVGYKRTCRVCGKEFTAPRDPAYYCSRFCRHEHYNAAYRARMEARRAQAVSS